MTITGLGLFILTWGLHQWGLHPFAWEPTLHPMWGWILFGLGLGLLITIIGLWPTIEEDGLFRPFFLDEWDARILLIGVGLLVIVLGWNLEFVLWASSYILGGILYLASFMLVGFGAWKVITTPCDDDEGFSDDRQHESGAGDSQDEVSGPFDPRRVLEITPGATQEEIHNAYKEQMRLNHPDRVSHLSEAIQELAKRRTQDINRAYGMLKQR